MHGWVRGRAPRPPMAASVSSTSTSLSWLLPRSSSSSEAGSAATAAAVLSRLSAAQHGGRGSLSARFRGSLSALRRAGSGGAQGCGFCLGRAGQQQRLQQRQLVQPLHRLDAVCAQIQNPQLQKARQAAHLLYGVA